MAGWTTARKRIGGGASNYKCRKDRNHDEAIRYARAFGWEVFDTHKLSGFCDFEMLRAAHHIYVEVKNPNARGKMKPAQEDFKMRVEASGGHWELIEHPAEDMERISREY